MLINIMIFSHENIMIFIVIYIVDIHVGLYHWFFRTNPGELWQNGRNFV